MKDVFDWPDLYLSIDGCQSEHNIMFIFFDIDITFKILLKHVSDIRVSLSLNNIKHKSIAQV